MYPFSGTKWKILIIKVLQTVEINILHRVKNHLCHLGQLQMCHIHYCPKTDDGTADVAASATVAVKMADFYVVPPAKLE